MTALTYSSDAFDHTTDAGFRAWGSTISAHLAAAGLVQTADSGQINWATVNRPTATNTDGGYEVWRFNDPLQATAPIFFKIAYGTSNNLTNPRTVMSVGTGSNGAGSLTGLISDSRVINSTGGSIVGNYVSKVCYIDGFFGCSIYRGVQGTGNVPLLGVIIQRTMDDSGAWTADGCTWVCATSGNTPAGMQSLNFIKGTKSTYTTTHSMFPGGVTSTLTDDAVPNYQTTRNYQCFPKVRPLGGSCCIYGSELSMDTQFSTALIGSTPRTYISLGAYFGAAQCAGRSENFHLAMLWE